MSKSWEISLNLRHARARASQFKRKQRLRPDEKQRRGAERVAPGMTVGNASVWWQAEPRIPSVKSLWLFVGFLLVLENGCQTCHDDGRGEYFTLDNYKPPRARHRLRETKTPAIQTITQFTQLRWNKTTTTFELNSFIGCNVKNMSKRTQVLNVSLFLVC